MPTATAGRKRTFRHGRSPGVLGLLLILTLACGVEPDGLELTLENIYGPRYRALQASLSPDGRHLAVTASAAEGRGIFLVDVTNPGDPVFWTSGGSPTWFPSSDRIVFTRDRDLWSIGIGDSSAVRLTNDDHDERAARVSPNGSTVAFYSGRSGYQDIWLVPAGGGNAVQLTTDAYELDERRWAPSWSPDSRHIAYISNISDYWADDVFVIDVNTGASRQLSRSLMASSVPKWSPDGRHLALMGTSKSGYWYEDLADIYVIEVATGAERTVDMQVYATDWLHNLDVFWTNGGSHLVFPYHQRGDFNLWSVPAAGGVATRMSNLQGALRSLTASTAGDRFAFIRTLPTLGPDVDVLEGTGGTPQRVTAFASEWATTIDPVEVSYRSYDGLFIQGFLYYPPGPTPVDGWPALVNVHGGGTNSYLHGEGLYEQYFASKGYAVLAVNYRGGSGFGREFQDLSVNDWANGQARDAAAAATWIRDQPWANGKVGVYGYSYGGITSMAAIARVPEAFDAAVPMAGIYDFADAFTNADRIGRIFIMTGHGGTPDQRPEVYAVSNTLARIDQIETPLLVMHGEDDVRAPYRQYELVVERLEALGKPFESHSYPGESHGLSAAARIDMYRRAEAFLDRHLRN